MEGFPELFRTMDEMKEEIGKGKTDRIWRNALKAAFQPVLDTAIHRAPADTGQMRDHIYMKVQRPMARDKQGKYYAGEMYMARVSVSAMRDDTVKHEILNKRGNFQTTYRNKKPVAVSQEFGNAATPAHPFLRTALESNTAVVMTILQNSLRLAIEEVAQKATKMK